MPAEVKVYENVSLLARLLEPHDPSSPMTLCATVSLLVQVTVVPVVMVTVEGSNVKLVIEIFTSPDLMGGKVPAGVGPACGPQAARNITTSKIRDDLVFIGTLL